ARDGRASVRDNQGADGSNPFPYEDVATRRHRNGAARAHLQSYPRHQHYGARTADRSDQDIALAVRMSLLTRFHRSKCGQRARASRRATTPAEIRQIPAIGTADTRGRSTPRHQPFSHGLDPFRTFGPAHEIETPYTAGLSRMGLIRLSVPSLLRQILTDVQKIVIKPHPPWCC